MKVFAVLALALACVSAASIPEKAVFPKDLRSAMAIEGRIINGYEAYPGLFPYQVGITLYSNAGIFWCGGSLIGREWVVTAAHCTDGVYSVTVYLGSTNRTVAEVQYNIDRSSIYQHSEYNASNFNNDITLVRIPPTEESYQIKYIRLPAISNSNSYQTYAGSWGTASGWGAEHNNGTAISKLKYGYLLVITNDECEKSYGSMIKDNKILCASTQSGTSTCHGDSGGPLALNSELIGVTSFVSTAGCTAGNPAGFARVTSFLEWIRSITGISY